MVNERKETTHEIIFPESYPRGVPQCQHGPALRLKSIKRGVKGAPVSESEKWVCSFDRNGPCHFDREVMKKCFTQTTMLKPDWQKHFVTNTNDKTQGQYFFADETIKIILAKKKLDTPILLVVLRLQYCRRFSSSSLKKNSRNRSELTVKVAPTKLTTFNERVDTFGAFINERLDKPDVLARVETEDNRRYRLAGILTLIIVAYSIVLHGPSLRDLLEEVPCKTGVLIHPTQVNSYRAILRAGGLNL